MKSKFLIAAASGALLFSTSATAQSQPQRSDFLGQLLGAMFGNTEQASEQTLETDWNQGRRPFAQRRAAIEARIDSAVRDGSLDRYEADQMRREYYDIVQLEWQYANEGNLTQPQRRELRSRYRALIQRFDGQGNYQDRSRWQPLASRNNEFEQRIEAGLRNRSLSRAEATQIRRDWRTLGQLEARYQRGGIDSREEADLWARYNAIDNRLGASVGVGFGNDNNNARWSQMETRLAVEERSGRISRSDAAHVRSHLSDLARLDAAYMSNGYNADERAYLMRRYNELDQMLGSNRR